MHAHTKHDPVHTELGQRGFRERNVVHTHFVEHAVVEEAVAGHAPPANVQAVQQMQLAHIQQVGYRSNGPIHVDVGRTAALPHKGHMVPLPVRNARGTARAAKGLLAHPVKQKHLRPPLHQPQLIHKLALLLVAPVGKQRHGAKAR
jgi:hypothetical protein